MTTKKLRKVSDGLWTNGDIIVMHLLREWIVTWKTMFSGTVEIRCGNKRSLQNRLQPYGIRVRLAQKETH